MPKVDVGFWQESIRIAKRRAEEEYAKSFNHFFAIYNSKEVPHSEDVSRETVTNINEVYSDVEIQRTSQGFRNPRIHIQPKQKKFYVKSIPGDPARRVIPELDRSILQQMEEQGATDVIVREGRENVRYQVIDGPKAAITIESALNYLFSEKKIELQVMEVVSDTLLAGMGGMWIDFKGEFSIPEVDSQYSKLGDIVTKRMDLRRDVIFDPLIPKPSDLHEGAWVGRSFVKTKEELNELKGFFKPEAINKLVTLGKFKRRMPADGVEMEGKGHSVRRFDGSDKNKQESDDRELGVTIWQIWKRPTLKERIKGSRGKILYFAEDFDEILADELEWPHFMDGFPIELLWYNVSNDRFYPTSDIFVYESSLAEQNLLRHYMKKIADRVSSFKILVDKEMADERVNSQIKSNKNEIIGVENFDKEKVQPLSLGNIPPDIFQLANFVKQDKQLVSMASDAQKGIQTSRRVSATEVAENARSQNSRQSYRLHLLAEFYERCSRKIIQLMQQYYTTNRMVLITGNPYTEWTDEFNRDTIQGEYFVRADVMSMNPIDEASTRQQMINILDLTLALFDDPKRYLKLISEGRSVNVSEIINEILRREDIQNDKIFPRVPLHIQKQADLAFLFQMGLVRDENQLGQPPGPDTQGNGSNRSSAVRPQALDRNFSTNVGAPSGPPLAPGNVVPPGGPPKI